MTVVILIRAVPFFAFFARNWNLRFPEIPKAKAYLEGVPRPNYDKRENDGNCGRWPPFLEG
jgi:hypothetical protein